MNNACRILNGFNRHGMSDTNIERIMELPSGIIEKWRKMKKVPPDVMVLLKILNVYPWIFYVANEGYKEKEAAYRLIRAAADAIHERAEK